MILNYVVISYRASSRTPPAASDDHTMRRKIASWRLALKLFVMTDMLY